MSLLHDEELEDFYVKFPSWPLDNWPSTIQNALTPRQFCLAVNCAVQINFVRNRHFWGVLTFSRTGALVINYLLH